MYTDFFETTKLNIHKCASSPQTMKIGTHENKWIHSTLFIMKRILIAGTICMGHIIDQMDQCIKILLACLTV